MIIDSVKVDYGVIDETIAQDKIRTDTSSDSPYSNIENTLDTTLPRTKIAYLEKDYFLLDGSFVFPENNVTYNVGWESNHIWQNNVLFDEYVEYIFENTHISYGIQINFGEDTAARDFEITYYKDAEIIGNIVVRDNTQSRYVNYEANLDWNRVRIHFTKVNEGQRARFFDITFGVNETYTDDLLIAVSASQTLDLTGDYTKNSDVTFTFFNEHFDINTLKGLQQGVLDWLRIAVWLKFEGADEYVKFGEYYSEDVELQDKGKTVIISGYDALYKLSRNDYRKGVVYPQGRSLGEWAEDVAEDAGIDIQIDTALYDIISTGYIPEVPHREALRLIAEAGNAVLLVDKNGDIQLKKLVIEDKGELPDDDIVEDSLYVDNPNKNLGVSVATYTFLEATKAVPLGDIDEVGLTEKTQTIEITYSTYPVRVDTVQVIADALTSAKISNIRVYSDRVLFDISGEEGDASWISVTGIPYNPATTNVTRGNQNRDIKIIDSNYLITGDLGEAVADYQYANAVRKYEYSAEVVTEKDIELGNKVQIENNNVIITKKRFNLAYRTHEVAIEGVDE